MSIGVGEDLQVSMPARSSKPSALLLGKEEATGGARDTNTKEEVQRAHVLHGKFTDEVMNDAHQILGFLDLT